MRDIQYVAEKLEGAVQSISTAITLVEKTGIRHEDIIRECTQDAKSNLHLARYYLCADRSEEENGLLDKINMTNGIVCAYLDADPEICRYSLWGALELCSIARDTALDMTAEVA